MDFSNIYHIRLQIAYNLFSFISGAFLIVYFIAMTFCGIPIFFQEVAIGQYLGSGGMTLVSQLCPLFKGKIWIIFIYRLIIFRKSLWFPILSKKLTVIHSKGQLISKGLFVFFNSSKSRNKKILPQQARAKSFC